MKTQDQYKNQKKVWLSEALDKFDKETYYIKGIEGLIEVCGYRSIEHISREMKKSLNKTPSQIVNEKRLAYASIRLENSLDKIIDIAYEVGYNSLSYFNRLFKNKYGISPMQYRKRVKDNE